MSYEHPTAAGTVQLCNGSRGNWMMVFNGQESGPWQSADEAARAASQHASGVADWDDRLLDISSDLVDWRPLGDSL